MDYASVRTVLTMRRKELKLNQVDLANRLEMSQSRISQMENGLTPTTVATLVKWSQALDLEIRFDLVPTEKK